VKAISLFSGVGGLDIGFERAGIETILQVEKDEHCLSVLESHWPDVERMTDVRDVGCGLPKRGAAIGDDGSNASGQSGDQINRLRGVDLIYGGFPCQDISIAGSRAGLTGEQSGLWFEFERIVSELRPRWVAVENVAGLLSSNGGADFGVILTGLGKLGFDASWAVLDAQHFGVPQRRRRVFIVGGPRGRRAEQVLSLCESCGGNPETCSEAREGATGDLTSSTDGSSRTAGNNGKLGRAGDVFAATQRTPWQVPHLAWALQERDSKGTDSSTKEGHLIVGALPDISPGTESVRRLTPRECERLMGWPDDWTRWGADGTEISDTQRYRMCGNGVVATVSEWLGTRLMAVDQS
jgi:DNA (cytosine-5)-methyltransferase 1